MAGFRLDAIWLAAVEPFTVDLAEEIGHQAGLDDCRVGCLPDVITVYGRPTRPPAETVWDVLQVIAPMWKSVVPGHVEALVDLAGTGWRTSGTAMAAIAAGVDRELWRDQVQVEG